jgi:2,5-furandicarboxylate decarboxylase 1
VHVRAEVSARWEAAAIAVKAQRELNEAPVLIFHRLRTADGELSPYPVVLNLFASRERLAFAVDSAADRVGREMFERRNDRVPPVVVDRAVAPVKQVVSTGAAVDLRELPALVHAAWDPGPYVSAGFLTTYDPDNGIDNCALQRAWISGPRELRIFPNRNSHNAWNLRKIETRGEDPRVVFWVGHDPAVYIGAEAKLGYPESHWEAASGMARDPLRLVPSETLGDDFLVPADAEFLIEGIVPCGQRKPEGPFGEYTGYFGGQRLNPCMEVTCISHRQDAFWLSIIPGYGDDGLGALRYEGFMFDLLRRVVPQVTNVYRPLYCHSHLYVQLHKTQDWQPRAVIMAALSAPEALKHVFVFDGDVDIFNERDVQWAIGTRSDWAKDLIVVPDLQAAGLDPLSTSNGLSTRAGIDCTKPAPPRVYEQRSFIPSEVMERIRLEEYLARPPGS